MKELSLTATQFLSQQKGNLYFSSEVVKLIQKTNSVTPVECATESLGIEWDPIFLKGVHDRWKMAVSKCEREGDVFLLLDEFESVDRLLAELVNQGNSAESIYSCMDAKGIAGGGDLACQLAVEIGWLLGAWKATWKELQTEAEEQCARSMAARSAEIIAEFYNNYK